MLTTLAAFASLVRDQLKGLFNIHIHINVNIGTMSSPAAGDIEEGRTEEEVLTEEDAAPESLARRMLRGVSCSCYC